LASKRCLAAAPPGCAGWRCTHRQLTSFGADDHLRPDCQSRHLSFCRTEDSHDLEATHPDLPQGAMCTASAGNAHLRQVGHGGTAHLCILHILHVPETIQMHTNSCTQTLWYVFTAVDLMGQVHSCLRQRPGPASATRTRDVPGSAKHTDQSNSCCRAPASNCNQSVCAIRSYSMPAAGSKKSENIILS
jgi:hypothetical protein